MKAVSLELRQANDFVDKLHRHHDSVHRDKFRVGCEVNGKRDIEDMEKLVEIGLMTKSREHLYHLNDDGKKFLQLVTGVEILPDMD